MNYGRRFMPLYETGIKTIPKKKKCKKAKRLSEEALQIAVKRRGAKNKGEKERYTHLNAEFQRMARRDKKAFLRGQCKEIEENNRMEKTRYLFKKIRDTKGTFHAKMGSVKDTHTYTHIYRENMNSQYYHFYTFSVMVILFINYIHSKHTNSKETENTNINAKIYFFKNDMRNIQIHYYFKSDRKCGGG